MVVFGGGVVFFVFVVGLFGELMEFKVWIEGFC